MWENVGFLVLKYFTRENPYSSKQRFSSLNRSSGLFCVTNETGKELLEWVVLCGLHGVQLGVRQSVASFCWATSFFWAILIFFVLQAKVVLLRNIGLLENIVLLSKFVLLRKPFSWLDGPRTFARFFLRRISKELLIECPYIYMSDTMPDRMPNRMPEKWLIECSCKCQIKSQIGCRIECQTLC